VSQHTQAQRTAAALLASGARLGILAPRSDAELARLDAIAGAEPRRRRQKPETVPMFADLARACEAPSLPMFEE
jgi:hypothetical protein